MDLSQSSGGGGGGGGGGADDADELIALFARVSTTDREQLVAQFAQILQLEPGVARFFLDASNWNVEMAVHAYLGSVPPREDSASGGGGGGLVMTNTVPQAVCTTDLSFLSTAPFPGGTSLSMDLVFVNTGVEPWPPNAQLALMDGEAMSSMRAVRVPGAGPRQAVTARLVITVPRDPGTHTGVWRLMSPSSGYFGDPLWLIVTTSGAPPHQQQPHSQDDSEMMEL